VQKRAEDLDHAGPELSTPHPSGLNRRQRRAVRYAKGGKHATGSAWNPNGSPVPIR
jgi:hypothetical protein